ncbi:MAG: dihydroorotase family protein [Candidatus Bathyarchaeota archaeon]|nr:dihydroorotase family protein [Candidatus Bathyarchaeota archaeon]
MTVDSVLNNAKVYLKQDIVECSLAIEEGKIFKIGKEVNMPKADEKLDLHNLLVLPGLIDAHVHLRDEAKAYKETFLTGTAAAAAGGFTTVLDMPNNTPVTMSAEALQNRTRLARRSILVNVGFYSEFPSKLAEVKDIVALGAVGFKLFMAEQVGGLVIDDDEALKEAFRKLADLAVPVAVHAEDHNCLKKNVEKFRLNKQDKIRDFLKAHNEEVEYMAVKRLLDINLQVHNKLHFCHLSTKKALHAVAEAKHLNQKVTCEVTPHHLLLTKDSYEELGVKALTVPPLRSKENMEALWEGIKENTVDTVGSDHAPHTLEEKESNSIWEVKAGVPGLETTLPLMLTLVHKKQLSLDKVVQLLAERPAGIFGLKDRGVMEQGKNADLVVIDFNKCFNIEAAKFHSKAKFSPFNGWEVKGKPVKTFVNGQLVMDEQEIVAKPGCGHVVRRVQI